MRKGVEEGDRVLHPITKEEGTVERVYRVGTVDMASVRFAESTQVWAAKTLWVKS